MAAKRKSAKSPKRTFLPEGVVKDSEIGDFPFTGPTWANDRRIADCGQARELYTRLYLENQLRAQSFAQVRNQIEGGRPFDPDSLIRNGEAWRTNVNFNDARSAFRRVSMPYWKMVHEVPRKISVQVRTQAPEVEIWNVAIAQAFDMFLDDWGQDYFMQFSGFCDDYVMYGTGHTMWSDEKTPRFQWMPSIQILMPKRTKSDVDKWELICLKREMTADELLKHVRDQKTSARSKEMGWNPDMVNQAIRMAAPGPASTRYFDPNFWQDMIVSNDLVIGGVWPPVQIVDVWASSHDGKSIRHYILTEKSDVPDYLYEADEPVDSFRKLFGTAFYNVGSNGLYHSIKGFGVMNYYYATAINRTKCRALDAGTFSAGMNFVKGDNTPEEAPPVENYSMINLFPPGLQQLQYYPQLGALTELIGMMSQNQSENNFTYNEPQKDIADTKTARQAVILADIANEMSTAGSSIFLSQYGGNIFAECVRRLRGAGDPDARKFQARCKELGVPLEVITNQEKFEWTVKTGASPTTASPVAREQIGTALMGMMNLPNMNARAILEFRIANLTGADGVNRFLLPEGQNSDPRSVREAMMENGDLAQGMPLPVDPNDDHVGHLPVHLQPLMQIAQAIQSKQKIDPSHLMALQLGMAHCQQHLQFLSGNEAERQQYKALNAQFLQIQSVTQGVIQRLAQAQKQAQSTGQPLQPQDVQTALQSAQQ